MKINKLFIGFILVSVAFTSNAQQDPLYAQYIFNPLVVNPAYAGFNENVNVSFNSRLQWSKIEGSPTTNTLSASSSFFGNKSGAGLLLMIDKLGINTNTEGHLSYAYHIRGSKSTLSFGLQAGFVSRKFDFDDLDLRVDDDPNFSNNLDPKSKVNFGAGLIYSQEYLLIGISSPRILNNSFLDGTEDVGRYERHYYLMAAYLLKIGPEMYLKPSGLVKSVPGTPLSVDVNINMLYRDTYWAGAYTRNLQTFGLMGQFEFWDAYRFGYAFELFNKGNSNINSLTTHEFMLSIDLALFGEQDVFQRYF